MEWLCVTRQLLFCVYFKFHAVVCLKRTGFTRYMWHMMLSLGIKDTLCGDMGLSCCCQEIWSKISIVWRDQAHDVQNSHHCIFSYHRNALGLGQEECNHQTVWMELCLWEYMWTAVDYVFGLRLHCCLPPGNMKWFSKDKKNSPSSFSSLHPILALFLHQSFVALIPLVLLSVVDGALWCWVVPWE